MLALLIASVLHTGVQQRTLNVFAAASLKEAFTTIARKYETANPGLSVKLSFAGSQTLAAQINNGAPADVFASAAWTNLWDTKFDPASMRIFVLNRLKIAVRNGFPGMSSVRDLVKAPNLVIADPAVPVGHYTHDFFEKASRLYGHPWYSLVASHVVSREQDVKAVLTKVSLGEADAGIVYASDIATAGGGVGSIDIPDNLNEIARYPVATPTASTNKEDAKHFIKFLLSADSQKILEQSGFISPTRPVHALLFFDENHAIGIPLRLPPRLPSATVTAVDEKKQSRTFTGVLVSALPGVAKRKQATFIGADGYNQKLAVADLKSHKAVLVRNPDGNYQLIVPGLRPSVWVNWLRKIVLQ